MAQGGGRAGSFDQKLRQQHQAVEFGFEMTGRRNKCKMIRGVNDVLARVVLKAWRRVGAAGSSRHQQNFKEEGIGSVMVVLQVLFSCHAAHAQHSVEYF